MNKYKVILVDDEEEVALAIIRKLDWESMGFEVPEYAHNALEALEIAEESRPDIVMTDIKMPYMDGMELSRNLRNLYPNIRIIIFSGFDEFEYAKEAIHLEAEEYILKPIDADELRSVFTRVHESLDRDIDEKSSMAKLEKYYMESLPILQEDFFASLVEGKIEEEKIGKYLGDYRIELDAPHYITAIIHISTSVLPEGMNPLLLAVSVRRLLEERLDDKWGCRFFSYLGSTVIIAQIHSPEETSSFTDECDRLCRLCESICKARVTIGIGRLTDRLSDIPSSYKGAREAVSCRVLYGHTKAINISEIAPVEDGDLYTDDTDALTDIFKKIRTADAQVVEEAAGKYIESTIERQNTVLNYRFFVMELVCRMYKFLKNNHICSDEIFPPDTDIYAILYQTDPAGLTAWFKKTCLKMHNLVEDKRSDTSKSFVAKAMDYVVDHYSDQNLSIDVICSHLGVSSAYFSTVFKKETGKTFVGYLTDYRMEKAVKMLLETDEKTYVIASKTGYSDPNYFSYVFKKQFGVSPSKYKSGAEG